MRYDDQENVLVRQRAEAAGLSVPAFLCMVSLGHGSEMPSPAGVAPEQELPEPVRVLTAILRELARGTDRLAQQVQVHRQISTEELAGFLDQAEKQIDQLVVLRSRLDRYPASAGRDRDRRFP
ncbi:hypothetical protein [Amycolatopsis nigrescens]|uniref:hypothetical protein n=1 Tax=Amycolatopsis nigrescens TaxID=381445 RepID=UPI00035EAF8D|nr:hypothetical protein [Amycolatopsis nigrescens]